MNYLLISGFLLITTLLLIRSKVAFMRSRARAGKLRARVVEYRRDKVPIRNDFTKIDYPYVILLSDNTRTALKLRYASSWKRDFDIGEEIDVFYHAGELLYWHAYDKGIYRYLPSTWGF